MQEIVKGIDVLMHGQLGGPEAGFFDLPQSYPQDLIRGPRNVPKQVGSGRDSPIR